jgi:hypothetical protein
MEFTPAQNPIVTPTRSYSNTSPTATQAKKTIDPHNLTNSSEDLINSLGYDAFTFVEDGKQREGSEFFLDYILPESKKFNNADDQIVFLVKVISKLYYVNEQLKVDHAAATNKDDFDAALKTAEGNLIKLVRETPLHSSSQSGERTVQQKIDAVEKKFRTSENTVFGGDCGLTAVSQATGQTVTRVDLQVCQNAYRKFADPRSSVADQAQSLEVMFGNLTDCKNHLRRVIDSALADPELSNKDGAKDRLQADRARLGKITTFTALLSDEGLSKHLNNTPVHISTFATKPGQWLEMSDMLALMLSKGFACEDFGIRQGRKPAENAKTVLTFVHVTTGAIAKLNNDAKPDLEYQRHQTSRDNAVSPGSHWTCKQKAAIAPQE